MTTGAVLVVDDDDDVRESLALILEGEGYDVRTAENGAVALRMLANGADGGGGPFALVLLDLFMPVMDGWTTYDELQRHRELARVPVVVCTSAPDRAPPGARVLAKPFDLARLLALVDDAVRGGAPADAAAKVC